MPKIFKMLDKITTPMCSFAQFTLTLLIIYDSIVNLHQALLGLIVLLASIFIMILTYRNTEYKKLYNAGLYASGIFAVLFLIVKRLSELPGL